MGSDERHFNVSLIVRDKDSVRIETTTFEERTAEGKSRTEVLLFTSGLMPYLKAKLIPIVLYCIMAIHESFKVRCCFASTKTTRTIRAGLGAQGGHFDFHTAPELCHECVSELLLLNIHGGEKAYYGRGRVGKGDRRVKPRNRRQPGRPRLPGTAARTTGC